MRPLAAPLLREQTRNFSLITDPEGVQFLQWCLPRRHLSSPRFRKVRRQIYKRINPRLQELRLPTVHAYRDYLHNHPRECAILHTLCLISISLFYRTGIFQHLPSYPSTCARSRKRIPLLERRMCRRRRALYSRNHLETTPSVTIPNAGISRRRDRYRSSGDPASRARLLPREQPEAITAGMAGSGVRDDRRAALPQG